MHPSKLSSTAVAVILVAGALGLLPVGSAASPQAENVSALDSVREDPGDQTQDQAPQDQSISILVQIPKATGDKSCTVEEAGETCSFDCNVGDRIAVSAGGADGEHVRISGSCGGVTEDCEGFENCESVSNERTDAGGVGTCKLVDGATGTCSAGPVKT